MGHSASHPGRRSAEGDRPAPGPVPGQDPEAPTGGAGKSRRVDSPAPTSTEQTAEWEGEGGSAPRDISAVDADGIPNIGNPVVEEDGESKLPVPPYGGD